MNAERTLLISALINNKSYLEVVLSDEESMIFKSAAESEKARKNGNNLFLQQSHDSETHRQVFIFYSKSIALAPNDSEELALALANKSALLLHLGQYQESLDDIEKAYKITSSDKLKVKLLCRKVNCLKHLGITQYQSCLDAAQNILNNIDDSDKGKLNLIDFINKVKSLSISQSNELKPKHEKNEIMSVLSKRNEILNSIRIECNKKYGRYLVANKDYNVGDIIFTEKLYAATLNSKKNYTNCHYCLKNCWSVIPCTNCGWAIFCSENCMQKAWKSFHDIECTAVPHIKKYSDFLTDHYLTFRMLVTGLKESGSIAQLKADLQSVDKCADDCTKGFFSKGTFLSNSIQSVYSLTASDLPEFYWRKIAINSIITLICLVKYSSLMEHFCLKEVEDFIKNEDLIFLGSLLIKLSKIKINNSHSFSHFITGCEFSSSDQECMLNECCVRGTCLASLSSLINHSCFPNAGRCFTEDKKMIVYALQPIKKDSQIFHCYNSYYFHDPLEKRQFFMEKYHFVCDCQPCVESWPALMEKSLTDDEFVSAFQNDLEIKLYSDCISIFKAVDDDDSSLGRNPIKKLSKTYAIAWKNLKQPSLMTCLLTEALNFVFSKMFSLKVHSFGECKNKN